MKSLPLILILFLAPFSIQAQSYPVLSYRENFFGNHIYLADGQKVNAKEMEKIISVFPENAGMFTKAKREKRMGESIKWGGWVLFTGSILYLSSGEINQRRALTSAGLFVASLGMASIGQSMKRKGKLDERDAIDIYNFKSSRRYGFQPDLQIKVSPLSMGLSLNF